jgi:glycosyltransferase involved in cell wall biosynthesis
VTQDIAVIVTFHNQKKYIDECLNNLEYLCGKYEKIKAYIINSGSTDMSDSEMLLLRKKYETFKFFKIDNLGASEAKNFGVKVSTETILTFLDGDDILLEDRIKYGLFNLSQNQGDVIIGTQKFIFEKEVDMKIINQKNVAEENKKRYYLTSMILYRNIFNKIGEFDNKYRIAGDFDWFLRAKRNNLKLQFLDVDFVIRRIHLNNASSNYEVSFNERNQILLNHAKAMKSIHD